MNHDYSRDAARLDRHLDNTLKTKTYGMGDVQHLGGAAALLVYLDGKHHGAAYTAVKKLKCVMQYLHMYATTGHEIYMRFAEHALSYVEQCVASIQEPAEQEKAMSFLNMAIEYMDWLKSSSAGPNTSSTVPQVTNGSVSL